MNVNDIKTSPPFNKLFGIEEDILNAIADNIRVKGFDESQPIVLWEGKDIVIDGHTRLAAAKKAEVVQVPTCTKPFADEAAALAYAIHNQRNRRNITDAELLRCIEAVDRVKERGGDRKSEKAKSKVQPCTIEKSSEQTAKVVGVSARKVSQARTTLSDPEVAQEVKNGKMSINQGDKAVKAKRIPATEKKKDHHPESDALHFATIARSYLNRIRDDDPLREKALEEVLNYIVAKLKEPAVKKWFIRNKRTF